MRVRHCDVLFPTGNQCLGNNSETRPCTPDSNFIPGECMHTRTYLCSCPCENNRSNVFFVFCNNEDYKKGFDYSILAEVFINLHKLAPNRHSRMLNPFCSAHSQVQKHTHTLSSSLSLSFSYECTNTHKVWVIHARVNTLFCVIHHHMPMAPTHFQESCDNEMCYWALRGTLPGSKVRFIVSAALLRSGRN